MFLFMLCSKLSGGRHKWGHTKPNLPTKEYNNTKKPHGLHPHQPLEGVSGAAAHLCGQRGGAPGPALRGQAGADTWRGIPLEVNRSSRGTPPMGKKREANVGGVSSK